MFILETLKWWHWIIFGLLLLIIEVNSGTFLFAGFAAAAILVGVIDLIFDISASVEILLWSALAVVVFIYWRRHFSKDKLHTIGQSDDALGAIGTVTEVILPHQKGRVRFDKPILGNTEWFATADETIQSGTRVKTIDVLGQLIKVKKEK